MISDWAEVMLCDVVQLRNGAGIKQQFFASSGIPVAKVSNFTNDSIDIKGCTFIDVDYVERWKNHILFHNDVLVATVGSWPPNWNSVVGKVVRVPSIAEGALQNQNTCCLIPNLLIDKRYLFYSLRTRSFQNYAVNVAGGSANQARIPIKKLERFVFKLPPLPEQKAIAHILGTLDDKIELNRKMNETLEAMAQALFKSWFVDFDPVIDNALAQGNKIPEALKAKVDKRKAVKKSGQYKALPKDIQALFPAAFVYNEELEKWIPEGWINGCLKDLCSQRKINAKVEDINSTDCYVGLEHIDRKSPFLSRHGLGEDVSSNKTRFMKRDILFGKLRPYFHKVCISQIDGICSTDILVFHPIIEHHHSFVFSVLFSKDLIDHVNKCSTGTRMPRASAKDILNFPILYSDSVINIFHEMVANNWIKGNENILNSNILKQTRGLLLSQLISGKTRLPESFIQQFESQNEVVPS